MKKYRAISLGLVFILVLNTLPARQVCAAPTDNNAAAHVDDSMEPAEDAVIYETIEINTAEDFLAFADSCHLDSWSANKTVLLKQDINLSGTSFETIPVFKGIFDGGGHTISGFRPKDQGYIVGLFRYLQNDGVIKNLNLKGTVNSTNEKQYIGSICGINYGTIQNCSFEGTVGGQNTVGGIAGINEATGAITKCTINGHIMGYYSTGGIAGTNHGIITFCNNYSGINDNSAWVEEDDEMGTGLFFSLQASEDEVEIYSGVDTGGIAGYSDGLIEHCNNYGRVGYEHTGYNIGGIAGRQAGVVLLCTNNGEVYGRKDVGGIVGQMEPDIEIDEAQSLRNAVNKLHDLIDQTLNDMQNGKNAIQTDFDALDLYGDGALSSGNAMAEDLTDFVNENMAQAKSVTERMEHIMDLLPAIMGDVSDSMDAFSRFNDSVKQLIEDLDIVASLDGDYNETDYSRVALLSTVGGLITSDSSDPKEGETVTITVTPNSDYVLEGSLSIVDAKGNSISYTGVDQNADGSGRYSFTMPVENVKVTAYFRYKDDNRPFTAYVALSEPDEKTDISEPETEDSTEGSLENDLEDTTDDSLKNEPEDTADDTLENGPESTAEKQIRLHSNLSGNASYTKNDNTVILTVRPDTAYTVSSVPVVTDAAGNALSLTQTEGSSYQYEFDITTAVSPINVEISFKKQTKKSALDTSLDNLQAAIQDLQESSQAVKESLQRINDIMTDENGNVREWSDLNESEKTQIINEIVDMSDDLGKMATSASTILSELSTIYNILSPYVQDAAKAARKDINKATDEIQSLIDSLKKAVKGIKGIVNYINSQPDIKFSPLDPAFDNSRVNLYNQLTGIADSLRSLNGNASEYSDLVNADLKAVNDQLNVVFNLLTDHLTDTSELSLEELYEEVQEEEIDSIVTGKTDSCVNNGIVKGDINIGGIAGSMSIDEEDPEDNAAGSIDYQIGRRFITKCIITDSINRGYITAKKDGAGGIVGYMRHGIVRNSESYGSIESTEGDYVGGIAGESLTIVQNCYSLCSVYGGKNVGGIAGYASTVHDCYAIVSVDASIGREGSIAGQTAESGDRYVTGNYYVGDHTYGIDNISYAGIAEPISYQELLTVEHLPTDFWHLKVTYRIEDVYLGSQEVKFGESLSVLDYPEIPVKDGYYGVWPDYSDQFMTGNLLIEGSYVDTVTVVESSEKTETEESVRQKPYALVEQTFTEDTILNVVLDNQTPPNEADGKDHIIYDISLENGNIQNTDTFAIRLLNPYGKKAQVWGCLDGKWSRLESKIRGEYLQVEMTGSKETFCIIDTSSNIVLLLILAVCAVIVILIIIRLVKRKRSKSKNDNRQHDCQQETTRGN